MREQKLSGAYKLADNRPTSPVDAHAHATRGHERAESPSERDALIQDLLRYLRYDTRHHRHRHVSTI